MFFIGRERRTRFRGVEPAGSFPTLVARCTAKARFPPHAGPRPLDKNTTAAVDRGDGSHRFYRVDLRSLAAARLRAEGSTSVDAAGHCGGEKEERPHRREEDLRLPAVRLSAGVLHGLDGDSRAAAHAAVPQSAGAADGADEEQDQHATDGSRSEL